MPRYIEDRELLDLGKSLIDKHYPNLKILNIAYVFREEASVSNGKVIAGQCTKVDPRNWTLHKKDVIIEIAKDVWAEALPTFQEALMDHELSHVGIDMNEDGTPKMDELTNRVMVRIKPHDIEEFDAVLERHGPYHKDLRQFLDAFVKHKEEQKKRKSAGLTSGFSNDLADAAVPTA